MFEFTPHLMPEDFRGDLIVPSDPAYDEARRVFNGMIDRRPALIARCTGVADVTSAIKFARARDLIIAVRAGGHSVAGYSVCDGGIVIDLSRMKGVRIDPVRRRARVQSGATWAEFDREAQLFGLATTGGRATATGVAGFALGGGSGYLERKHGYAADNVTAIDLVTADGSFIQTSATEHPDLFWAMRGAGANFGIATELEFRLHPVGPEVLGGLIGFPGERMGEVLKFYREFVRNNPEDLGLGLMLLTTPVADFVPREMRGRVAVAIVVVWTGDLAEGDRLIAPIRQLKPMIDTVGPTSYRAIQAIADPFNTPGMLNYWKAGFLDSFPDEAVDALVERVRLMTSPLSHVLLFPVGGAIAQVGENDTPLGGRSAQFNYHVISIWEEAADCDSHLAWAETTDRMLHKWAGERTWLNYLGDEGIERVRSAYGPEVFGRLQAVKNEWDPDNLFQMNQNIPPSRSAAEGA